MLPSKVLRKLDLLCWSTVALGLERGWISHEEVIDYAAEFLNSEKENKFILMIIGGDFSNTDDLLSIINQFKEESFKNLDFDKWRLAYLICISESGKDEVTKLDLLQEVYSKFEYPEDMDECSIYSQSSSPPLSAMNKVIAKLKMNLGVLSN